MALPLIVANWKMNKTVSEAYELIEKLKDSLDGVDDRKIVVCPAFVCLGVVSDQLKGSNIKLGAQNMYFEDNGAFTGEISPAMLKELGCEYVILGHSERREHFKEDDALINKKVKAALQHGLKPILCVGETKEERDQNQTKDKVKGQLEEDLKKVSTENILNVVIAYEPIWAIGTGENATPEQAEEVHAFIRGLLSEKFGQEAAEKISILYGGSVKPGNAKDLMGEKNINGCLVGGASLSADDFTKIVGF